MAGTLVLAGKKGFYQFADGQTTGPGGTTKYSNGTQLVDPSTGLSLSRSLMCNSFRAVDADWTAQADGTFFLATNKSAKKFVIPIHGLKAGDQIVSFTVKGGLGGTAANHTTVDADLRKVTPAAGGSTDASVGAITQVDVVADATMSASKTFSSAETVATGYQYYILVTGTTANNAANDITFTGAEVVVNRKL